LIPATGGSNTLAVPAQTVFELPELPHLTAEAVNRLAPGPTRTAAAKSESEHAVAPIEPGYSRHSFHGRSRAGRGRRFAEPRHGRRGIAASAHGRSNAGRGPSKRLAQMKKRRSV
jgi:hypothetical protein